MNSKGLLIQRFHSKYATSDLFHVDCFIMSCMNWQQLILNAKIGSTEVGTIQMFTDFLFFGKQSISALYQGCSRHLILLVT